MPRAGRLLLTWLSQAVPIVVALAVWEGIARSGLVNPRLFPRLAAMGEQLVFLLGSQQLGLHLGASLTRVVVGFGLAVAVGVPLGILMSRVALFGRVVEPVFSFGYPIPRIALYPIAVFLLGIGHASKIVLITLECLYPIAINTYYGVRNVNRLHVWSAQNMGASRAQVILKVMAPAAAPHVFSGLRIALPIAFIITVLTEMVTSTEGLGWLILYSSASLVQARVFAGVAIVAVIGFIMDRSLAALRNRLIFWEKEAALVAMR
ncbi:MAG: ABC transporter permease [Armatimonadota bacterium]